MPSGRHDGTAIAVSGFPTTYLGRTLEKSRKRCLKSRAWNLVEMAVVSPVETVSPGIRRGGGARRPAWRGCAVRAGVVLLLVLLKPKCAPISLPHGTLAGGCEGNWDSTWCTSPASRLQAGSDDGAGLRARPLRGGAQVRRGYVACDPEVVVRLGTDGIVTA